MHVKRIAAIAALTAVASMGNGGIASAQKPASAGNPHTKPTTWMSTGDTVVEDCAGAEICETTGSHVLGNSTSGSVSAGATLARTTPYAGWDQASDLSDIGLN